MNLYELLFELIDQNVPVDPKRFNGLRQKAQAWYFAVVEDKQMPAGESRPPRWVADFIRKYGELWYVQVALAAAFPFLNKWIDGMTASDDLDDEVMPDRV